MISIFFLFTVGSAYIIGDDSRRPFPSSDRLPFSAIGIVETNKGNCTGTMVSPCVMLTCAHCINWNKNEPTGLRFIPRGSHEKAIGTGILMHFFVETFFKNNWGYIPDDMTAFDFAFVKLDRNIGLSTGWMSVV
ncbi:MAG: trypsin-like serine peptidase, partial [Cetobacterium sp.]